MGLGRDSTWQSRLRRDISSTYMDPPSAALHLFSRYTADMQPCSKNEVLAQEDKDKHSAFLCMRKSYIQWSYTYLLADPTRYAILDRLAEDLAEEYRLAHVAALPRNRQHWASEARWAHWRLGYTYLNFKAKCFADGVGRTCPDPQHSCMRRINSMHLHPARMYYRSLGRALRVLVQFLGVSWSVHSLRTAVRELMSKVRTLAENPSPGRCQRCEKPCGSMNILVTDASQMFEEIDVPLMMHRLDMLVTRACAVGFIGVVVLRSRRLHGWLLRRGAGVPPGAIFIT